jgi:hypothetical protein
MIKRIRYFLPVVLGLALIFACGGGSDTSKTEPVPAPASEVPVEKSPEPTQVPDPTATSVPVVEKEVKKEEPKVQKPAEKPSKASSASAPKVVKKPTSVPPTSVPPTPVPPTPVPPTPKSVKVTVIDNYGFLIDFDSESDVQSAGDSSTGTLSAQLEGAKAILLWLPVSQITKELLMQFTYGQLTGSEPDLVFTPIAQNEISVDGQDGLLGVYASATSTGQIVGAGLIGTWNCADSGTVFALTVVGEDATTLQIRFQRLTSNFSCSQ